MNWKAQVALALADTAGKDVSEKIISLRTSALLALHGYLHIWESQGFLEFILNRVCEKKIQFIQEADTKGAMTEILMPPFPRYHAGKVISDSRYAIEEEELLLWALVSPAVKLIPEANERYCELFKKYFGSLLIEFGGINIMEKISKMKELIAQLLPASEAYYKYDNPVMTDREYDKLYDELAALEKETGITLGASPTQKVQGMILESLSSIRHTSPMLSADKTKSVDDLVKFMDGHELMASWKEDGLTIVLRYAGGKLHQAITRGSGEVGEEVTEQAKTIRNLPLTIPYTGDLEVRGECLISWETYSRLKEEALEAGEEIGHPRNVAGGAVRQLDVNKAREKGLMFKAFEVTQCRNTWHCLVELYDAQGSAFYFCDNFSFEILDWQEGNTDGSETLGQ